MDRAEYVFEKVAQLVLDTNDALIGAGAGLAAGGATALIPTISQKYYVPKLKAELKHALKINPETKKAFGGLTSARKKYIDAFLGFPKNPYKRITKTPYGLLATGARGAGSAGKGARLADLITSIKNNKLKYALPVGLGAAALGAGISGLF